MKRTKDRMAVSTRLLLAAQGVLWIILAFVYLVQFGGPAFEVADLAMPILMAANAAGFLLAAWALAKIPRWLFYGLLAYVGINGILAVTDEVGLLDLAVLVMDAATMGLLLVCRRTRAMEPSGDER